MIGSDYNDRLVILVSGFEMVDDPPKMVIDLARQRQIERPHHRCIFQRQLKIWEPFDHIADRPVVHRRAIERVGGAIGIGITGCDCRHHRRRVIHAVIGCRRHKWRMRSDIGHMSAPAVRTCRQIGEETVCQKGGVAVLCPVERWRVWAVASRHVEIIAGSHIIAAVSKIATPGPAVVESHFQRLEKAGHDLFIGC